MHNVSHFQDEWKKSREREVSPVTDRIEQKILEAIRTNTNYVVISRPDFTDRPDPILDLLREKGFYVRNSGYDPRTQRHVFQVSGWSS